MVHSPPTKSQRALKVLFIGNSFTARNNLPGLVAQQAEARGRRLEHRLFWAGGASLRRHWNQGAAQKALRETRYDYVVLQEQSTLPIQNPERMWENIRLFDEAIKESGAKTALLMTWARADAPETQAAITAAYSAIGRELGALVIPVGIVWQKNFQPAFYDKDQRHPSFVGSQLAAGVVYTTLFNQRRGAWRRFAAKPPVPQDERHQRVAGRR